MGGGRKQEVKKTISEICLKCRKKNTYLGMGEGFKVAWKRQKPKPREHQAAVVEAWIVEDLI
jgi:hypothetical protein